MYKKSIILNLALLMVLFILSYPVFGEGKTDLSLEGMVIALVPEDKLVLIGAGSESGITGNESVDVIRGSSRIAVLKITSVSKTFSTTRVIPDIDFDKVELFDRVKVYLTETGRPNIEDQRQKKEKPVDNQPLTEDSAEIKDKDARIKELESEVRELKNELDMREKSKNEIVQELLKLKEELSINSAK